MTSIDAVWVLICAFMVLEMQAGFLFLEAGLVRSKNSINVALKNVTDLCLVGLLYWAAGFALMFGPSWLGLIGLDGFLFDGDIASAPGAADYTVFYFQLAFAGTAVTIVSGAVSERAAFRGYLLISAVAATIIYPVYGHWVWGSAFVGDNASWLAELGFIDFAGSTVVHGVGGWIALAYILQIGPRIGRFGRYRHRFEASNLSMAACGALLLWIGWAGFNGGSALMFNDDVPSILVNTVLAAAAGGSAVLLIAVVRDESISVSNQLNGILAGLVAVTASCHIIAPSEAVAIGGIGAMVMRVASDALERLKIDDAVDATPVHLFSGVWGTLAVALFGDVSAFGGADRFEQLGVQMIGVMTAGFWSFTTAWLALKAASAFTPLRVSRADEREGLNVAEHNESSALRDLTLEMKRHRTDGRFTERAHVEYATEAGFVAKHYNMVLDRAETELQERERAALREAHARRAAEEAKTALHDAQRKSEWAARHDALTGLANRRFFDELIERIESFGDEGQETPSFAAIAIDLDRFKPINDTYGHAAGDYVLRQVANALRSEIRRGDFMARMGGDEFVIVIDMPQRMRDLDALCHRLLERAREPILYETVRLSVGASIGYAVMDEDCGSPRDVLANADLALYRAKAQGRNRVEAYSKELATIAKSRQRLVEDLEMAINAREFEPFFQPQFDAKTGALSGVEALARWRHPELGMLSPAAFLDVAEEVGLTPAIDQMMLDKTLRALAAWDAAGFDVPRVSVNVSVQRLRSQSLLDELNARQDIPRGRLVFEILETVFVDANDEQLIWTVDGLREIGIEIEIDDFGTGHASISSILALQPHRLKLDRIFVDGVERDSQRRGLMRSLIGVAESMKLYMIGEGVENEEQARILADEGCAFLQGYALAKPMDRASFDKWLAAGAISGLALGEQARRIA